MTLPRNWKTKDVELKLNVRGLILTAGINWSSFPGVPERDVRPSCCAAVLMTQLDSNVNEALQTKQSDTLPLTLSHWRVNKGQHLNVKEPLQDYYRLALSICPTWWLCFYSVRHCLKVTTSSEWPSLYLRLGDTRSISEVSFRTVLNLPPTVSYFGVKIDCTHLKGSLYKKEAKHCRTKNVAHWWPIWNCI